ncbi:MAG: hypothetical protein ACI4SZ_01210 [Lachnospiraceae bacterium]
MEGERTKQGRLRTIMNRLVNRMTARKACAETVVFIVLLWLIDYSPVGVAGLLQVTGGANILDFESGYTVDYAYGMLEALGEAGRSFHLTKIMPLDIFFPVGLMIFLTSWMSLLLKRLTSDGSVLRLLPLIAVVNMLLDWSENIGITLMLLNYPERLETVCRITSTVSAAKMVCVKCAGIILLLLIICRLVRKICCLAKSGNVSHVE